MKTPPIDTVELKIATVMASIELLGTDHGAIVLDRQILRVIHRGVGSANNVE
jgi:hypothetical protein